jgi:hypothetical protein
LCGFSSFEALLDLTIAEMRRKTYRVTFTGFGAMNSKYTNQVLELEIRHDWNYTEQDAEAVLYIVREKIKGHFRQFEIHSIEQLH